MSSNTAVCTVEDIVDNPNRLDSLVANSFVTKTDRDVDFWGVGAEARFGKGPVPAREEGGYLFRLGYVGIGADLRGIDQDIRLRLDAAGAPTNPAVRLNETLDTTYWGGFLSVGGEYNILGYLGIGKTWGIRSLLSLVTDYEYFSYAPEMRYVDADRSGCGGGLVDCAGKVTRTPIDDDDAFAVRTMLRLNVGLGSAPLYADPALK